MSMIQDSVETVNAAAAIVVAEGRVHPAPIQKRRWGRFWSLYWCFGYQKNSNRIGHAALVPESISHSGNAIPVVHRISHPTSIVLPLIAPPSSPASVLRSDPSTGTHTPAGLVKPSCLPENADSLAGPANVFAIGPYANETQLVSPPVFSAFTTEPSTATATPPAELVQLTTPSSPEVPFAQLLTSSLNNTRRNGGSNHKHGLSCYDFHQVCSGSPTNCVISPRSVNSASGTSSPYPIKQPILELHIVDASKLFDSKKFATRRWGSRLGSGSLTPDGVHPASRDSLPLENQISELALLPDSTTGSQTDHRASFKFAGEEIPICIERRALTSLETVLNSWNDMPTVDSITGRTGVSRKAGSCGELYIEEAVEQTSEPTLREAQDSRPKHLSVSFGSVKEFNFDCSEIEVQDEQAIDSTWSTSGEAENDAETQNSWAFFSLLRTRVG